jgi:hypothetical protein
MDYGRILSRAWEIIWENKFLWVLGFLVALGSSGGGGSFQTNFNSGGSGTSPQMQNLLDQYGVLLAGLGCLLVIIALIFWLVRMVAEAGLISSVERIEEGGKLTLGEAFGSGRPFLGRMVGLNLLLHLPIIVSVLVSVVVFFAAGGAALVATETMNSPEAFMASFGILVPCFCLLLCLIALFSIAVALIYPFAARSAILGNMGVVDSIRNGWSLFRSHISETIIVWFILVAIAIMFGFLTAAVLLPLSFLAAGPAFFRAMAGGSIGFTEIAPVMVGGLCIGVLGALLNSVLTTYHSAVFTLVYRQFVQKNPPEPAY